MVYNRTACTCILYYLFNIFSAVTVDVQGKRNFPAPDDMKGFIQIFVEIYGQYRPEYFFLHEC